MFNKRVESNRIRIETFFTFNFLAIIFSHKRIESSKTRIENCLESLIDYNEVINVNIKM